MAGSTGCDHPGNDDLFAFLRKYDYSTERRT